MDLKIDDFFSERKSFDVQELINDSIPVYPDTTYFDCDLSLFFYMPYDDRYCDPPSYGYMDSFEMFKDYFEFYSDGFIYGFIGDIIDFHDKFGDGYTDFPTTKKRLFGMGFDFGKKNKSRLLMQIILMFHQHGDYHQKSVSIGLNSIVIYHSNIRIGCAVDNLRKIVENFNELKHEENYWKVSEGIKSLFCIDSDKDVLQMHTILRHFQERSRVSKFYKYDNRKKIVSVPSLYVQSDKDTFDAYKYRQFLSDCISKGNPQFDWQYIDYITRLRDK
jgi:hypothetical protein